MQNPDSPVELVTVPNDLLAAPLVSALQSEGIQAQVVGCFTAGFLAEAPGSAQVVVRAGDLAAAQEVLERYNAAAADGSAAEEQDL